MAIVSTAVTVTNVATRLDVSADADHVRGQGITLRNNGSVTVYLGGADVTAAQGFPLAANEIVDGDLPVAAPIWGITASGSAEVRVLQVGV